MKKLLLIPILLSLCLGLSGRDGGKKLIPYVDVMTGTGERFDESKGNTDAVQIDPRTGQRIVRADKGQTIPAVLEPNGMNFWTPETESTERKGASPFYYSREKLTGFRASHWITGGATQDYGSVTVMPGCGPLKCLSGDRASLFSHEEEAARPDYYSVPLFGGEIFAEMTGTSRTGIFRFTYKNAGKAWLVIQPNSDEAQATVCVDPGNGEVSGSNPVHRIYQGWGEPAGFSGYFSVTVSKPVTGVGTFSAEGTMPGNLSDGNLKNLGAYLEFDVEAGETVLVRVATSFCDVEGARANQQAENPGWDFDAIRDRLTGIWEDRLSAIRVETPDEVALTNFYTALYHASFLPHAFNDADGRYPSFAGGATVEKTDGTYYEDYSMWDTYRALHPLLSILYPEQTGDMIQSLIDKYRQGGWLPIFPCWNSYTSEMIGDHCASLIADAYFKGIRNFDVEAAWEALRKNAFDIPETYEEYKDGKGRRALDSYLKYGYIPLEDPVREAFHRQEQVSRTLEYAYDDYALAKFARELGHKEEAAELARRSQFYRNVIDPRTGYAQGRHEDGTFIDADNAFDKAPFITEGKPCHYSWYVPHDLYGLMECMGGRDSYVEKLDTLFGRKEYWHGNEPCHQIAYLYNYAGLPWKTQETVRGVLLNEYHPGSDGLSGNDDAGQMSAWYIFSSLGFYPVCPASGHYVIGSPLFRKASVRVGEGKVFTIKAKHASDGNLYIRRARLNGKRYDRNYLLHEDIAKGGTLVFVMGRKPSRRWASSPESCPPRESI
ncbi:MAG: GH92 family glycosyl hydrolase [Bacteroidales bacterium]|nr:GH92 family glycosyl hydrolase [Bacteroidales bacterium]